MGVIYLNNNGNGYTYCVPPFGYDFANNESFTIHFNPDSGETLEDVRAFDSFDYPIALPSVVNNTITMNFRSAWRNMYLDVYYSGSTPPSPPAPKFDIKTLILLLHKRRNKKIFKF